uniref:Uncharacterized protein n=1 Tax=Rhizophora mucronata TaxID=61149 RepID=A0A2P2JEB8_RHIMU
MDIASSQTPANKRCGKIYPKKIQGERRSRDLLQQG